MLTKVVFYIFTDFPLVLSIINKGMLKSPSRIVDLSIFFLAVVLCFEVLLLGA